MAKTFDNQPSSEQSRNRRIGAAARGRRRRGISTLAIVLLVIIVVLIAVAAVAVLKGMRSSEERDRALLFFHDSSQALDKTVSAAARSSRLKGAAAASAREEVFQPALVYYQDMIKNHGDEQDMWPEVARAQLQTAVMQVKDGSPDCAATFANAIATIRLMSDGEFAEEDFPSLQGMVLSATTPLEWGTVKTKDLQSYGFILVAALRNASSTYRKLSERFPQSVVFRDDLAAIMQTSATLLGAVPSMGGAALGAWTDSSKVLETLVRDQPANVEYQSRLVDSLVNAARLQKSDAQKAAADYRRACEVLEKMLEATPDDKILQAKLKRVKSDLEKIDSQAAQAGDATEQPPADEPAPPAEAAQ